MLQAGRSVGEMETRSVKQMETVMDMWLALWKEQRMAVKRDGLTVAQLGQWLVVMSGALQAGHLE